jgi:hypothetical protein
LVLPENALNGGFPEPPTDTAIRVVDAHHDACGASTRVRLPSSVPARAVHRFHCSGCAAAFEAARVEEFELRVGPNGEVVVPAPAPAPVEITLPEWVAAAEPEVAELEAKTKPKRTPAKPKVAKPKLVKPKAKKPKVVKPKAAKVAKVKPPRAPRPKLSLAPAMAKLSQLSKTQISLPKMPKLATANRPSISLPSLPSLKLPKIDTESRSWKLLSIPIAAVFVVVALMLLRGGDAQQAPLAPAPPQAQTDGNSAATGTADVGKPATDSAGSDGPKPTKNTKFVHESSFSLAMPAGWARVDPPAGATFMAVAANGGADATLWITKDPKLDYPTFVSQSLAQLETLAGSARIVERIPGPTAESTTVRIASDAPPGQPTYEATLRVAGPYRYYLATTTQPDSTPDTLNGVELITGSLTPELGG